MSRGLIVSIGLLLLAVLCWFCIERHAGAIEADLATRTGQALGATKNDAVQVRVDGRDVTLSGQVASAAAQQQVVALAQRVHGVRSVSDQLQLVSSVVADPANAIAPEIESETVPAIESATSDPDARAAEAEAEAEAEAARVALAAASCQTEFDRLLEAESVQFESSAAAIKAASYGLLNRLAEVARTCPTARFEIAGHTDSSGGAAANKRLSERRARAVQDYLSERGIDARRLSSAGYGAEQPKVSNDTPAGRAQNRRVELVVEGV
ncbi:MAG: OmpA family protein [Pseudomonadales bacterium]